MKSKMHFFHLALIAIFLLSACSSNNDDSNNFADGQVPLAIPNSRPRIWFTDELLDEAQTIFQSRSFSPSAYGNIAEIERGDYQWHPHIAFENAFYYLLTGDTVAADSAIAWARFNLGLVVSDIEYSNQTGNITSDAAREYGEGIIVVYDWCHDRLSTEDRAYFFESINAMVDKWNYDTIWGTPEHVSNNYNHGYMRNSFLWGVASFGENERSEEFISHGLFDRWGNIEEYFETQNMAGIPQEGTSYGESLVLYPLVMFMTARNIGYDIFDHEFMKRVVMYTIYNTTLSETYLPNGDPSDTPDPYPYYMAFPFGDAGIFTDPYQRIVTNNFSLFMAYAAYYWRGTNLAQYIQGWFDKTGANTDSLIMLNYLDWSNTSADISNLPLDYYPPQDGNIGMAFAKNTWNDNGMQVHMQLVTSEALGHEHNDGLNFQVWRDGYFITTEAIGRGVGSGYTVPPYNGSTVEADQEDVEETVAHNSLLFGGEGQPYHAVLDADVLRMESRDDYFFAAVDGTPSYNTNENIQSVIREFLFIRDLEVLIVFDRMQSSSTGDLSKTFLMHFWGTDVSHDGNAYTISYPARHSQTLKLTTLLPDVVDSQVIDESINHHFTDLQRIQLNTDAAQIEYFLNVIEVRDSADSDINITFTDNGDTATIQLNHPTKGNAAVTLVKGVSSAGGTFSDGATTTPLTESVQSSIVSLEDGFRWVE